MNCQRACRWVVKRGLSSYSNGVMRTLMLEFGGLEGDVRLLRTTFTNAGRTLTSSQGKGITREPGVGGAFQWSAAVKAMSLLFVRTAIAYRTREGTPDTLSGTSRSWAASLDMAIAKGADVSWLAEIFGTQSDGDTVAKKLFVRTNSHRRTAPSEPVVIRLNVDFLPRENVEIRHDGTALESVESLQRLAAWIEGAPSPLEPCAAAPIQTFHDRYRAIWRGMDAVESIVKAQELLATTPRPYAYLSYEFDITANELGHSTIKLRAELCNCGHWPLTSIAHEYSFENPQSAMEITVDETNRLKMTKDSPTWKAFAVEFKHPLQPRESWRYELTLRGERIFIDDHYWDMPVLTAMNSLRFSLSHTRSGRLTQPTVEHQSDHGPCDTALPSLRVARWNEGAKLHWEMAFPKLGIYRVRWRFVKEEEP